MDPLIVGIAAVIYIVFFTLAAVGIHRSLPKQFRKAFQMLIAVAVGFLGLIGMGFLMAFVLFSY